MSKKVVYILGAGASAQAIPTYKDFVISLDRFRNLLVDIRRLSRSKQVYNLFETLTKDDLLENILSYNALVNQCIYFGTPDTLAVTYSNEPKKLRQLKKLVEVFLIYLHYQPKDNLHQSSYVAHDRFTSIYELESITGDKINSNYLDKRYLSFWASILGHSKKVLPDDIGFIIWNYDFQLVNSLLTFKINRNKINDFVNKNVVFMNGTCLPKGNLKMTENVISRQYFNKLTEYLFETGHSERNKAAIKFSWEAGSDTEDKAKQLLTGVENVVYLGYSMPDYNRMVDLELMGELQKTAKKIYIQDLYATELVSKVLEFKPDWDKKVSAVNSTSGFYIPPSYWRDIDVEPLVVL